MSSMVGNSVVVMLVMAFFACCMLAYFYGAVWIIPAAIIAAIFMAG